MMFRGQGRRLPPSAKIRSKAEAERSNRERAEAEVRSKAEAEFIKMVTYDVPLY